MGAGGGGGGAQISLHKGYSTKMECDISDTSDSYLDVLHANYIE